MDSDPDSDVELEETTLEGFARLISNDSNYDLANVIMALAAAPPLRAGMANEGRDIVAEIPWSKNWWRAHDPLIQKESLLDNIAVHLQLYAAAVSGQTSHDLVSVKPLQTLLVDAFPPIPATSQRNGMLLALLRMPLLQKVTQIILKCVDERQHPNDARVNCLFPTKAPVWDTDHQTLYWYLDNMLDKGWYFDSLPPCLCFVETGESAGVVVESSLNMGRYGGEKLPDLRAYVASIDSFRQLSPELEQTRREANYSASLQRAAQSLRESGHIDAASEIEAKYKDLQHRLDRIEAEDHRLRQQRHALLDSLSDRDDAVQYQLSAVATQRGVATFYSPNNILCFGPFEDSVFTTDDLDEALRYIQVASSSNSWALMVYTRSEVQDIDVELAPSVRKFCDQDRVSSPDEGDDGDNPSMETDTTSSDDVPVPVEQS